MTVAVARCRMGALLCVDYFPMFALTFVLRLIAAPHGFDALTTDKSILNAVALCIYSHMWDILPPVASPETTLGITCKVVLISASAFSKERRSTSDSTLAKRFITSSDVPSPSRHELQPVSSPFP
eukprot:6179583-Pleurochrysis_carterae.AAC.6